MTSGIGPGDGALLGMIVDRSSFDDDELSRSQSFDEVSVRRKNGRVRRKLKWKPPGLSLRRKAPSPASSNESVRSGKTNWSFHTFSSTETPVQSNKKSFKQQHNAMPRPNYPDTFEGVSTIDNEGGYVHSRMETPVQSNTEAFKQRLDSIDDEDFVPSRTSRQESALPTTDELSLSRSHTMPSRYDDIGGLDFESISMQPGVYDPFVAQKPRKSTFDQLGMAPSLTAKKTATRPPTPWGGAKRAMRPPVHRPSKSRLPSRPPRSSQKSQISPNLLDSTNSDDSPMEENFPMLSGDDYEPNRRVDNFSPMSSSSSMNGPDASGTIGASPALFPPSASPILTNPHQGVVTPDRSATGRQSPLGFSPRKTARLNASPKQPVPARVDIDLDSPKTLESMLQSSGLLASLGKTPEPSVASSTRSRGSNRQVDAMTSSPRGPDYSPRGSVSKSSPGRYSDDDSMSTKSGTTSQEVLIVTGSDGVRGVEVNGSGTPSPRSRSRRRRSNTGPVDVDEGQFLEAERNLRAIHQMAAEHLAHGEYVEALEVFEEILRGQRERYGPGHYRVGTALHNIGIVHLKSQQYDKAIQVCKEAVKVRKAALVPNHPDVAVSLAQLGVAHLECQQHREALIAFQEALKIRRQFLGPRHPKVGKILNNIGCALYELSEMQGAKLAFEEALEIQRETLRASANTGEDETGATSNQALLSIASTLCNLGSIKLRWGQFEEASVALEEALLIQQSVLGDDHPSVLSTIESIKFVDASIGRAAPIPNLQHMFGLFDTERVLPLSPEDAAMQCGVEPPEGKIVNLKVIMALGLNRSKRLYQQVEDMLVPATMEVCGPIDADELASQDGSTAVSPGRQHRAEV